MFIQPKIILIKTKICPSGPTYCFKKNVRLTRVNDGERMELNYKINLFVFLVGSAGGSMKCWDYTHSHIYITYTHIYTRIHIHKYTHTFIYIYIHIFIHIFTYTCTYTHIQTHILIHIRTHIFTFQNNRVTRMPLQRREPNCGSPIIRLH